MLSPSLVVTGAAFAVTATTAGIAVALTLPAVTGAVGRVDGFSSRRCSPTGARMARCVAGHTTKRLRPDVESDADRAGAHTAPAARLRGCVHRTPVLGQDYATAVCSSTGQRVFIGLRPERQPTVPQRSMQRHIDGVHSAMKLLAESMAVLQQRIRQAEREQALRQAQPDRPQPGTEAATGRVAGVADGAADTDNTQLWIDKYRAQTFVELLSSTETNRVVLEWLKQWDQCVFGRCNPPVHSAIGAAGSPTTAASTDPLGRPAQRVRFPPSAAAAAPYGGHV